MLEFHLYNDYYTIIIATGHYLQPGYEQGSLMAGIVHILTSYGNTLMETICKDACNGHDVDKVDNYNCLYHYY